MSEIVKTTNHIFNRIIFIILIFLAINFRNKKAKRIYLFITIIYFLLRQLLLFYYNFAIENIKIVKNILNKIAFAFSSYNFINEKTNTNLDI